MKALKIIRNIILALYLIIGIFAIVCTAFGWTVTPIMSPNADSAVGSLLVDLNEGLLLEIPLLGYVVYYCWTLPGKIILGLIGALLISTFFFDKGEKQNRKATKEEVSNESDITPQLAATAMANVTSDNNTKKEISTFDSDDIFTNSAEDNTFDNPVTGELIEKAISDINEDSNMFTNTSQLSQNVRLVNGTDVPAENNINERTYDMLPSENEKIVAENAYSSVISKDMSYLDVFLPDTRISDKQPDKDSLEIAEDNTNVILEDNDTSLSLETNDSIFEQDTNITDVFEPVDAVVSEVADNVSEELEMNASDAEELVNDIPLEMAEANTLEAVENETNIFTSIDDMGLEPVENEAPESVKEKLTEVFEHASNNLDEAEPIEVQEPEVNEVLELAKKPTSEDVFENLEEKLELVESADVEEPVIKQESTAIEDEYLDDYYDELPTTKLTDTVGNSIPLEDLYLEEEYTKPEENATEPLIENVEAEVSEPPIENIETETLEVIEEKIDEDFEVPTFDYQSKPDMTEEALELVEIDKETEAVLELEEVEPVLAVEESEDVSEPEKQVVDLEPPAFFEEEKPNHILEEMKAKFTELEDKYNAVNNENQKLNDKILSDSELLEKRKTEIKNLQNKLSVVNKEIRERKSSNTETLAALETLKLKLADVESEKEESNNVQRKQSSEIDRLKKLIEGAQDKNASLVSQVETLKSTHKSEIEKLQSEINVAKRERDTINSDAEQKLKEYKQKNEQLEANIRQVVELDEQNKAIYEKATQELEKCQKEVAENKLEFESLSKLYDKLYEHYTQTVSYLVNIQLVSEQAFEREQNAFKR